MTPSEPGARSGATIGRRVREQRIRAGLTQDQLAEKVARHRVTIARIETDAKRPSGLLVTAMAKALDIPRDAIDPEGVTL